MTAPPYRLYRSERAGELPTRIYLPNETVRPLHRDGLWVATVTLEESASRLVRDHGFMRARAIPGARRSSKSPPPRHPIDAWLSFKSTAPKIEDEYNVGRIPVARDNLDLFGVNLERPVQAIGDPLSVTVVLTLTGWRELEIMAVERAIGATSRCGAQLIVVQNLHLVAELTEAWCLAHGVRCVSIANTGFAAACNAGARAVRATDWILFTQADAVWDEDGLRWACGRSRAVGHGMPHLAAVGPSGGNLNEYVIREVGRNVRNHCGAVRADFITGYWVLVPRRALRHVGGWDEGYFLYWEDPDLCLRLAMVGCVSVVDTAIEVEHRRSATIGSLFAPGEKGEIQSWSQNRFQRRWGL